MFAREILSSSNKKSMEGIVSIVASILFLTIHPWNILSLFLVKMFLLYSLFYFFCVRKGGGLG